MTSILRTAALSILALSVIVPGTASAQANPPTVTILDFEFGAVQRWWSGNEDIGKGIADMLVDELVNDGSFRVIERKRLDVLIAEQNLSASERADPSAKTIAQIGKLLGVRYLIVGSITKFGTEESSKRVGAGAFGRKYGVGDVGTAKGKASVAITARIVDTTTGEIMASAKGDGTSKRSGLLLSGGGGGALSGTGRLAIGSSDFRETIIGEATEAAIKATAAKLIAAKGRLGT